MISKTGFLLVSLLLIEWSVSSAWGQDWRYLQLFTQQWSTEEENSLEEGEAEQYDLSDAPFIQLVCTERLWAIYCPHCYRPICVTDCIGANCKKTYPSACKACSHHNVKGYTPGTCEVQRTVCALPDLSATDIACNDIYDPVCAFWSDCTQEPCGKTVGNACQACSQQGASYYHSGECP